MSLLDLYQTLLDLCGLPSDTTQNAKGRPLDGHSLKPLLVDPKGKWNGPKAVLTAMYQWPKYYDPAKQNDTLRDQEWRYIRYENGKEELYHVAKDAHEWTNLAQDEKHQATLVSYRNQLLKQIPKSILAPEESAENWKDTYFKKHPAANTDENGKLTWPELKTHKKATAPKK